LFIKQIRIEWSDKGVIDKESSY